MTRHGLKLSLPYPLVCVKRPCLGFLGVLVNKKSSLGLVTLVPLHVSRSQFDVTYISFDNYLFISKFFCCFLTMGLIRKRKENHMKGFPLLYIERCLAPHPLDPSFTLQTMSFIYKSYMYVISTCIFTDKKTKNYQCYFPENAH